MHACPQKWQLLVALPPPTWVSSPGPSWFHEGLSCPGSSLCPSLSVDVFMQTCSSGSEASCTKVALPLRFLKSHLKEKLDCLFFFFFSFFLSPGDSTALLPPRTRFLSEYRLSYCCPFGQKWELWGLVIEAAVRSGIFFCKTGLSLPYICVHYHNVLLQECSLWHLTLSLLIFLMLKTTYGIVVAIVLPHGSCQMPRTLQIYSLLFLSLEGVTDNDFDSMRD
jgi:hypothetical protein